MSLAREPIITVVSMLVISPQLVGFEVFGPLTYGTPRTNLLVFLVQSAVTDYLTVFNGLPYLIMTLFLTRFLVKTPVIDLRHGSTHVLLRVILLFTRIMTLYLLIVKLFFPSTSSLGLHTLR
ncbi:hypothetical protein F5887DRAFT_1004988 [Amanita rubescens]|nr:hypothetical protein F5887DRAFT_1004988 [Amanita rubescens]